jgi:hypothetical protein
MEFKDQNTRLVLLVESLTRKIESFQRSAPVTPPREKGGLASPGTIRRVQFSPATKAALKRVKSINLQTNGAQAAFDRVLESRQRA